MAPEGSVCVWYIRHGENPANLTGELSCRNVDYPLTERGVAQATALARSLASAAGGSLLLGRAAPKPVFTVTFPVAAGSGTGPNGTQSSPGGTNGASPRAPRGWPAASSKQ